MAAVVASKPHATATKMKKPSLPAVQTSNHASKSGPPSASPSSAAKRLPGQTTPQSAVNGNSATVNGASRPNRRLQRLSTRTGTSDTVPMDKKAAAKRCAEPYVQRESFILKKFKGRPPSLIVHLHPTHFRFDQQDGSFSYASDMKLFIKHLRDKTVPHDMLEELRSQDVQFYDGWLIVKVLDHKSVAADASRSGALNDDEKPFSIHNHNNFITPSPYAPYPTKDQRAESIKQERQNSVTKDTLHSDLRSDDTIDMTPKNTKPQPKVFHVALAPTLQSKEMDMVIDARAPDPKTLNRKQSQIGARTPGGGQPPTPIGAIPSTPATEKPPPAKRQKTKIDPKDLVEYEARIVNATAPPLFLDLVHDEDQAKQLLDMMEDEWHNAPPPSPKSRKRTVAELAADDAHAKEQEKFMLVMDERNVGNNAALNAGAMEGQTGTTLFQPRFEKFNALDSIKRDIAEKKQLEKDRQLQEDEARRGQQQQEEERRRMLIAQQHAERRRQAVQAAQQQQQQQQQHAQALAAQKKQAQRVQQPNGIPPQMQNPMAAAQASSPVIRQDTPHAASSPIMNNAQGGHPMMSSGSQQGQAGSPQRPGSAVQHGHPNVAMARGPSNQGGPSRNGTPQLAHNTPGMRNATPVMRQETPNQHTTQASPHGSMAAPTPQMGHAGMMGPGQMPNGMVRQQLTPQQMQHLHAQRLIQQQQQQQQLVAAQQAQAQQQMMNGVRPQVSQADMAHLHAQQQAQLDQNAVQRMQQQQAAMQQGTPQPQHMSPSPAATQGYKERLAAQMKAQMQSVSGQVPNQASPAPAQMTPQQHQMLQRQQHQQQQMMAQQQAQQQMGQQAMQGQRPSNPQLHQLFTQAQNVAFRTLMNTAAMKYGGNVNMIPPAEKHNLQLQAQQQARNHLTQKSRQMQAQAHMQRLQQQQQAGVGGQMPNGMVGTPGAGGQINSNMAQMHQHQQAQQMQAMQMQHAQSMMQQAQVQGGNMGMAMNGGVNNSAQAQYQQQLNLMQQQQQQQGQGGR